VPVLQMPAQHRPSIEWKTNMAIEATYLSATQFTVNEDRTSYLRKGLRLQLLQGVDGIAEATVSDSSYDVGAGLTTCSVSQSVLTTNLATIKLGATYADPDSSSCNLAPHRHTGELDGGLVPAAAMTVADVEMAKSTPIPSTGDANKLQRVLPTENGYSLIALQGTENQVNVAHNPEDTTLSLPQNIHAGASPTFDGLSLTSLTLSALTGILEGKGSSPVGAIAAAKAFEVLRRNAENSGYEFVPPFAISGRASEDIHHGEVVYSDKNDSGNWKLAQSDGTSIEADASGIVYSDTILAGSTGLIVPLGLMTDPFWSWTPGAKLYLSEAPGQLAEAAPANSVALGHAITAQTILFYPMGASGGGSTSSAIAGPQVRHIVEGRIDRASDTVLTWTPVSGSGLAIYDGGDWQLVTPSSLPSMTNTAVDIDEAALAVNSVYDLFAEYDTTTSFKIAAKKWGSPSARGYTLYQHEGVLVHQNTPEGLRRRFLATICTYDGSGTVNFKDEKLYRYVSNYYNKKRKALLAVLSGSSWNRDQVTWVLANGDESTKLQFVLCQDNTPVVLQGKHNTLRSNVSSNAETGIGVDSASSPSADCKLISSGYNVGELLGGLAYCPTTLAAGYHYACLLEHSNPGGGLVVSFSSYAKGFLAGELEM
jgi:hypothetical protein